MATLGGTAPFWEKDGTLRAYANRMLILVVIETLTIVALAAVIFFQRQIPPTIIRISATGEPTVISPVGAHGEITAAALRQARIDAAPTAFEKEHAVNTFVQNYWQYDEYTLTSNWAIALNMMTKDLQKKELGKIQAKHEIAQMQKNHESATVNITSTEEDPSVPMVYHIYATRITSSVNDGNEVSLRSADVYTIRLVKDNRSKANPSGLLIAAYSEKQISSEAGDSGNQ